MKFSLVSPKDYFLVLKEKLPQWQKLEAPWNWVNHTKSSTIRRVSVLEKGKRKIKSLRPAFEKRAQAVCFS